MARAVRKRGADGLRRLRWRRRGAWLWPAFAAATVAEAALLRWLPVAGDGTGPVAGVLLAGSLNVAAVALLGTLGGRLLRRARPELPRVVADDRAGLAALALVAGALVAAGLAHRPALRAEREALAVQDEAVRRWVRAHGDAFARAHVDRAVALRVDDRLFRTCLPTPDPDRWLCLIVDAARRPPRVTRDASAESNALRFPRGVLR